jgi:hypothetical protein
MLYIAAEQCEQGAQAAQNSVADPKDRKHFQR